MVANEHATHITDGGVLRSLLRQLPRLDLELVRARGLSHVPRRHQRIVHIYRRRRSPRRAGGERKCSAEQNPQFPHRLSPLFWVIVADEKPARTRAVPTADTADQANRWTTSASGATASSN